MSRQHATPLLLPVGDSGSVALRQLSLGSGADQVSEAELQALVHAHPSCLPIAEIDPMFANPVPICTELSTPAGPIDNLLVTPSGLPVLVECKLWRNPEARREVVGQILDYAKELSRWTSSDIQREVRRRLGREGDPVLELMRGTGHSVDEIDFSEALSINLRRGRFLLLIVGDGIREGVEAIAEYLQAHAGLHFSLGLVEMPIYEIPDGARVVVPRVLARTHVITRTVVAVPQGHAIDEEVAVPTERSSASDDEALERLQFWTDFVAALTLDDPDQSRPNVTRQQHVFVMLPVPGGNCWITAFRSMHTRVGVFLSYTKNTIGERAVRRVAEESEAICRELGGTATVEINRDGKLSIVDRLMISNLNDPQDRAKAIAWLAARTNDFVNVIRPRIKSAVVEFSEE